MSSCHKRAGICPAPSAVLIQSRGGVNQISICKPSETEPWTSRTLPWPRHLPKERWAWPMRSLLGCATIALQLIFYTAHRKHEGPFRRPVQLSYGPLAGELCLWSCSHNHRTWRPLHSYCNNLLKSVLNKGGGREWLTRATSTRNVCNTGQHFSVLNAAEWWDSWGERRAAGKS